ncbi:MAG: prepilin-type N-terminal cleavage/methylation domain-containing protein, partial [Alcaligenaceae bacterium]
MITSALSRTIPWFQSTGFIILKLHVPALLLSGIYDRPRCVSRRPKRAAASRGFSLIEVLVAILVLSFGV